ncbi:hypothetical protein ACFXAF_30740, partial [Kitasatospora sp. NPDC059463]|uniref:hypothetical protein n=1 Tax=Kitasatospora sp. NPDC059463 TaxID=3346842 RepID=UPI00368B8EE3
MTSGRLLDRHAIGGELRALADRPGLASRQEELRELGLALSGAGDLDRWAELDLVHSFVRPESVRAAVRPGTEPRFWAWAEVALGALVFVPLLVTWAGLMQATSAYRALIGADAGQAARPFLQLWQTGFEGRLSGWATFGDVALSATLFITLLLVLSVAHGVRRAGTVRREAAAEAEAEDLLAELAPVLTRAQLVLNERRRATPQRFTAELTGAAETLERLGRQAADTQRELSEAALAVERSVAGAERRLTEAGEAVDPLRRAVDGVEKAVDGVGKAVDGVGVAVRDSGERLAETVRDGAAATDGLVHRGGKQALDAAELVRLATDRVGAELAGAGERVEEAGGGGRAGGPARGAHPAGRGRGAETAGGAPPRAPQARVHHRRGDRGRRQRAGAGTAGRAGPGGRGPGRPGRGGGLGGHRGGRAPGDVRAGRAAGRTAGRTPRRGGHRHGEDGLRPRPRPPRRPLPGPRRG